MVWVPRLVEVTGYSEVWWLCRVSCGEDSHVYGMRCCERDYLKQKRRQGGGASSLFLPFFISVLLLHAR